MVRELAHQFGAVIMKRIAHVRAFDRSIDRVTHRELDQFSILPSCCGPAAECRSQSMRSERSAGRRVDPIRMKAAQHADEIRDVVLFERPSSIVGEQELAAALRYGGQGELAQRHDHDPLRNASSFRSSIGMVQRKVDTKGGRSLPRYGPQKLAR